MFNDIKQNFISLPQMHLEHENRVTWKEAFNIS